MGPACTVETSAARAGRRAFAGRRPRRWHDACPGSSSGRSTRGAVDALAARLPAGVAVVSATNGKTTTSAMARARSSARATGSPGTTRARTSLSGIASTLLAAPGCRARPARGRRVRAARADRAAYGPRVVSLGNLFRDQLDRYGELEHIAERWRAAIAALPATPTLVVNADDPARRRARGRPRAVAALRRSTTRASRARRCSTPPTRSTASAAAPRTHYAAAYVGHLGDYRCPACGHRAAPARRRRADDRAARRSTPRVRPRHARRLGARASSPSRSLQRLQRARPLPRLALALDASLDEIVAGLARFTAAFGRFERIEAGDKTDPDAADQEPRRSERGGADARRGRRARSPRDRPERRDRRRPGRLVDLGRRLRAAARAGRAASSRAGERAAELALRFAYGGFPA